MQCTLNATICLEDANVCEDENNPNVGNNCNIKIVGTKKLLSIMPEGYGEMTAMPGTGAPILIEYHNGELKVIIFGDINKEDPTHVIPLEGAREDNLF